MLSIYSHSMGKWLHFPAQGLNSEPGCLSAKHYDVNNCTALLSSSVCLMSHVEYSTWNMSVSVSCEMQQKQIFPECHPMKFLLQWQLWEQETKTLVYSVIKILPGKSLISCFCITSIFYLKLSYKEYVTLCLLSQEWTSINRFQSYFLSLSLLLQ